MEERNEISSIIFRFQEAAVPLPVTVHSIGWEMVRSGYSFEGMTRDDPGGSYLFQYSISGMAMIRIGDRLYRLEPGKAFLVPFKGDYHYYMPPESDRYECLFASFDGPEAEKCWGYLEKQLGPVLPIPEHAQPLRFLQHVYREAKAKKISDTYKLSTLGYQFLMELYRFSKGYGTPAVWPDIVEKAVRLIDERYSELQHLDELSARLGISKYYLIKLFHRTVGKTPLEYLTRKRMEKAAELLRATDRSLDEIAQLVGFQNVNYFSKVFRKHFGIPPGQFRKKFDRFDFLFD